MSDEEDQPGIVGYPKEITRNNLTEPPKLARYKGRKAPSFIVGEKSDRRSPADLMRALGFEPTRYMNPLQFLIAVMNDDLDLIFRNEARKKRMMAKGGLAVNYRIEAAKTAARYFHMELPKVTVTKDEGSGFGASLMESIEEANERASTKTRRIIIEEVQRISPDIPLTPASYPPGFDLRDEDSIIDAEGDTDYDPDND